MIRLLHLLGRCLSDHWQKNKAHRLHQIGKKYWCLSSRSLNVLLAVRMSISEHWWGLGSMLCLAMVHWKLCTWSSISVKWSIWLDTCQCHLSNYSWILRFSWKTTTSSCPPPVIIMKNFPWEQIRADLVGWKCFIFIIKRKYERNLTECCCIMINVFQKKLCTIQEPIIHFKSLI